MRIQLLLLLLLLLLVLPLVLPAPQCLRVVVHLVRMTVVAMRQPLCHRQCGRSPSWAAGRACHN
jgi:hypothetical protein